MDKGLELLFDYTKFHIGVYLTLAAAYITVWPAVIFIIIAGFAGGVIASSITQTKSVSVESFLKEQTGPWGTTWFTGKWWTYIEHTSFWIGIACVVLSFAYSG
jgi:hypothetical protein